MAEEIKDPRLEVLDGAIQCVTKNRNRQYGEPEDNFRRIAAFMNALMAEKLKPGEKITEVDVAGLSICIKMGRIMENPCLIDNAMDLAGYAACMYQVALRLKAREDADRFGNSVSIPGELLHLEHPAMESIRKALDDAGAPTHIKTESSKNKPLTPQQRIEWLGIRAEDRLRESSSIYLWRIKK